MADKFSPEKRSKIMAKIRGVTAPERTLRAMLVQKGISGFRVSEKVEGIKSDLVFSASHLVIFVDGCFWHGCPHCYVEPKSNVEFWRLKIQRNRTRDKRQTNYLKKTGWKVLRIWECQLKKYPHRQLMRIIATKNPDK